MQIIEYYQQYQIFQILQNNIMEYMVYIQVVNGMFLLLSF